MLLESAKEFIDINSYDEWGKTALHVAAEFGSQTAYGAGIVSELLKHGANVNASDSKRCTPLHIVLITLLQRYNFNVALWGNHAVHERIGYYLDTLNVLLRNGADLHAEDCRGATPVSHAYHMYGDLRNRAIRVFDQCGYDLEQLHSELGDCPLCLSGSRFCSRCQKFFMGDDTDQEYCEENVSNEEDSEETVSDEEDFENENPDPENLDRWISDKDENENRRRDFGNKLTNSLDGRNHSELEGEGSGELSESHNPDADSDGGPTLPPVGIPSWSLLRHQSIIGNPQGSHSCQRESNSLPGFQSSAFTQTSRSGISDRSSHSPLSASSPFPSLADLLSRQQDIDMEPNPWILPPIRPPATIFTPRLPADRVWEVDDIMDLDDDSAGGRR